MTRDALIATGRRDKLRTAAHMRPEVLLYILTIFLPVQASLGGLVLSGNRLLLLLLVIPLTVNLFMGRYGRLLIVDILFFLHVFWGVVALAINNPDRVVTFMGSNSIELIGGYLIGRAFIRTSDEFLSMCKLLVGLTALTLPLAIYETVTGTPILLRILESLPGLSKTTTGLSSPRFGLERVRVFLAHPIHYGLFTGMLLSVVFVGFKGLISNMARYALSLVMLICVFLSLSSGPFLALLLQFAFIFWAWLLRGVQARWLILSCTVIAAYVIVDVLSDRTPFRVFLHYATFNPHTAYWRALIFEWGMKNVWDNPIFGLGLNDWVRPVFMYSGSMDNFWLVMAVRYGIPGFLLLAIGFGVGLWHVGRRDFHGNLTTWQLRQAWMISIMSLTFALCTVHIWGSLYSFVFFFFGAGMWFITAEPEQEGTTSATTLPERNATLVRQSPTAGASLGKSQTYISASMPPRIENSSPYTRFPANGNAQRRRPSPRSQTER